MIEALGNIGDFIGGIGVVITLLYLAFQVRQNSRSVKAAAAQGVLGSLAQTLNSIGSSPQASRVFALGQLDPSKLTDEEVYQFIHLILGYFRIIEQAFYQNRLGGLDEDLWNGHVAQVRRHRCSVGGPPEALCSTRIFDASLTISRGTTSLPEELTWSAPSRTKPRPPSNQAVATDEPQSVPIGLW
jgi:hypothetical protein